MPHERVMRVWGVAALLAGASATTPASEVAALRDFYGALGGDGWLDSHHWNSTRDPCSGIALSARGRALHKFQLIFRSRSAPRLVTTRLT